MTELHRAVVQYTAWIRWSATLEVIIEYWGGPDVPREGDREFAYPDASPANTNLMHGKTHLRG